MSGGEIVVGTPVGALRVAARNGAIIRVSWPDESAPPADAPAPAEGVLMEARAQIEAWFAGAIDRFSLPLAPGGTGFQRRVWRALTAIPHGETRTYGEIAAATNSVARAVGGACGANPIPVIVPCHRVVAAGGGLGGWSGGGGLETKRRLIAFEAARAARGSSIFDSQPTHPATGENRR